MHDSELESPLKTHAWIIARPKPCWPCCDGPIVNASCLTLQQLKNSSDAPRNRDIQRSGMVSAISSEEQHALAAMSPHRPHATSHATLRCSTLAGAGVGPAATHRAGTDSGSGAQRASGAWLASTAAALLATAGLSTVSQQDAATPAQTSTEAPQSVLPARAASSSAAAQREDSAGSNSHVAPRQPWPPRDAAHRGLLATLPASILPVRRLDSFCCC